MNITPITKKYINPVSISNYVSSACKGNNLKKETDFSCPKTIVNYTRKEFSNSRGNCLADIDLSDCFVSSFAHLKPAKVSFLADMELSDAYDLPVKRKKNSSEISFMGKGEKYLYILKQSAINLYKNTKMNSKSI